MKQIINKGGFNVEINFVIGYVEKNCSVRCYTFLKEAVRQFKIKYVEQLKEEYFNNIDLKASKEFFKFLELLNKSMQERRFLNC